MAISTIDTSSISGLGYGFKNRIINGAMMIDQRNAGASVSVTSATQYALDRWQQMSSQSGKYTVQQNAGSVTPPAGYSNYLGITVGASANVTVGAADFFGVRQSIEGYNIVDLNFGKSSATSVAVSFWVRSSVTGTFYGSLQNNAADRAYPFSYTINSANTWEQKTVTVTGETTGTWLATNGVGINVAFSIGFGSNFNGTANTWNSSAAYTASNEAKLIQTNGATFYITGVQLEKGSTATSFDYRPYGTELALCQRYYQQVNGTNNYRIAGQFYSTTAGKVICPAYVPFRTAPSVTETGLQGQAIGTGPTTFTGVSNLISGIDAVAFDLTGATSARGTYQQLTYDGVLTMSAEL